MAKQVTAQVAGGVPKIQKNVDTVEELRDKLELGNDYTATVNGEVADDEYELSDYEFVSFSQKVKGGN
jgi:uncharacterized protein YxjI